MLVSSSSIVANVVVVADKLADEVVESNDELLFDAGPAATYLRKIIGQFLSVHIREPADAIATYLLITDRYFAARLRVAENPPGWERRNTSHERPSLIRWM